jgi:hypothetical protein
MVDGDSRKNSVWVTLRNDVLDELPRGDARSHTMSVCTRKGRVV